MTVTRANDRQLRTTDLWAPATMKNAAKCDTRCDTHEPVSHRIFERNLRPAGHVCLSRQKPGKPRWGRVPERRVWTRRAATQVCRRVRHRRSDRQDHPLDLSISVSGGEETNRDSRSSGERSGNSSGLESRKRIVDQPRGCAQAAKCPGTGRRRG